MRTSALLIPAFASSLFAVTTISIVDQSSAYRGAVNLTQADIPNLQTQLDRDFTPKWIVGATLELVGTPSPCALVLTIQDFPGPNDPQGVAGYHSVDASGRPFAKVFGSQIGNGIISTVAISHEILEMLADPFQTKILYPSPKANTWRLYGGEVSDPVARQHYPIVSPSGWQTDVADFVFPNFWMYGSAGPWDQMGVVFAPVTSAVGNPFVPWIDATFPSTGAARQ